MSLIIVVYFVCGLCAHQIWPNISIDKSIFRMTNILIKAINVECTSITKGRRHKHQPTVKFNLYIKTINIYIRLHHFNSRGVLIICQGIRKSKQHEVNYDEHIIHDTHRKTRTHLRKKTTVCYPSISIYTYTYTYIYIYIYVC